MVQKGDTGWCYIAKVTHEVWQLRGLVGEVLLPVVVVVATAMYTVQQVVLIEVDVFCSDGGLN